MKHRIQSLTLALGLFVFAGIASAAIPGADLGKADQVRFHRLCRNLIAPCCWSQPVDVHESPAAEEARVEVAAMIHAGMTDRQILDSFIQRYGQRILAEPEGIRWLVLTVVPIVTLISGGLFLGWFLLRHRRPYAQPASPDAGFLPDWDWEQEL